MNHSEIVEAEGHLVDSQILSKIMDRVIECGAVYEVIDFRLGRTNDQFSQLRLRVLAPSEQVLNKTLAELVELGCYPAQISNATLKPAPKDRVVPDDFYSTTNHRTHVRNGGVWLDVANQRMDAVIIINEGSAECRKLRDVKEGETVVCGTQGIRIQPEFKERDRLGFAFMANEISSERRTETVVRKVADMMRQIKAEGGRIVFVAGPVVIHTGGSQAFCEIIRRGYVDALLAGNAIAVHDIEHVFFGTSLGVDLENGIPIEEGHKNHMRAINMINRYGSIKGTVEAGVLRSGVMYECVRQNVPFVLAGSIRDDGPLPDTEMDLIKAQEEYAHLLFDVKMVICLSSMLHSIGVGNMLPSWVRMVCVDINPAVVTKLSDRGSQQTVGVVTDVGTFLNLLAQQLWT
ncbi:MAG: TIGR00300 family protein [Acidobacteria bacterium]|nr:TIGR00300 family protein [Acidobacteriota bacterium]